MDGTAPAEARLDETRSVLVAPRERHGDDVVRDFFGAVVAPDDLGGLAGKTVYVLDGTGAGTRADGAGLRAAARVFAIGDGADSEARVPRRVHGLGVYWPRFFAPATDWFARISGEHAFQSLTESTKPGTAHRSGIYLTPVTPDEDGDGLRFRLLRCSTNLSGPTDNFRATDTRIAAELNREADAVLRGHAPLNHVLAQIYHNTAAAPGRKQAKAKISSHADKTKDMPPTGIMAFCTFYDRPERLAALGDDGLTRLHFRRKEEPQEEHQEKAAGRAALPERFTVPLRHGSVFLMPLSTNRLYTHEIRPSPLDADRLPTRLGYVVRCSAAEAVHRGGRTYLETDGGPVELDPPTEAGVAELRRLYALENRTADRVDYRGDAPPLRFSMNAGDYRAPLR